MDENAPQRRRFRLTKRSIEALPPGPGRGIWYHDTALQGFFIVCYPRKRTFHVRMRVGARRPALKIGTFGILTVEQARDRARELLASAELGHDPAAERRKVRSTPTFGAWVTTYLGRVALTKKSASDDRRYLTMAVDAWKNKPVDMISTEDVANVRQTLAATPTQANRWHSSVRACLAAAVRSGHMRSNPASGLKKFAEAPPRARVLTPDELEALLGAIAAEEDVHARAALTVLVETGARLSEVLRARWTDLDLAAEEWRIPSPKAGKPQTQPLAKSTAALLRTLPRVGAYVVLGREADKPRHDLAGPWARALERAGLTGAGIHIHDLRRTFGLSIARSAGLHVASKLLRHSDIRITQAVYAPLGLDDLRVALEARAPVLKFEAKK